MTEKEKEYMREYKRTCEVSEEEECYKGSKYCASCMYCINDSRVGFGNFENSYCLAVKRIEAEI